MIKLIKNILMYRNGRWKHSDIMVADRRIAQVDDEINCRFDGLEIIDGCEMRAIPGYIDQHVHITGGGGEGGFSNQVPPLKLSSAIKAGVTTIVGLLGTDGSTRSVESLLAKTKAFREKGLTAYCLTGAYEYPSPTITGSVKKDIIMIDEIIGVKIAISDHRSSNMSTYDLVKLASDAWQAGVLSGKPGIVHLHIGGGRAQLDMLFDVIETTDIPIACFRPTHLGTKLDAAMRFANAGGYADFTTGDNYEQNADIIARALQGSPKGSVTMSTDSNGSMPVWNEKKEIIGICAGKIINLHETVKALVGKENIPLEKAIAPCTENVARALKLYPRKGCLKIGSDADIILLDDNMEIHTVMAMGKIMMQNAEIRVSFNFEES